MSSRRAVLSLASKVSGLANALEFTSSSLVQGLCRAGSQSNAFSTAFSATGAVRGFASDASTSKETVNVTFVEKDGKETKIAAPVGKSILEVAHENEIDLEGACEGSLACSTCHVILEEEYYKKLEEPDDDEQDMLDLAFGLTETSRLGCQIKIDPKLEGMRIKIPNATRNMAVDGFKPKPH